jgi:teichuronic acid biosynthesis protein TuaE
MRMHVVEPVELRPGALAKLMLFLLPPLAVLGGRFPVVQVPGANLFAFRLAVLAAAFFPLLIDPRLRWLEDRASRVYAFVGAVWLFWGGLSLFWAAGTIAAVVDVLAVAFGFLTALTLANLRANSEEGFRWLLRGWVTGAVVAAVVATWEITTGGHLPGSWVSNTSPAVQRFVVVSTFDNPNNYGAFLLLVSTVVLYQMEAAASKLRRSILFVFVLWMFVLSVLTTSRVALVGVLSVLLVSLVRVRNKLTAAALILTFVGGLLAVLTYWAGDLAVIADLVQMGAGDLFLGRSSSDRLTLLRAGLDMTASTYGFGVGGGNFSYLMERDYAEYQAAGVIDPHNWWIEILSQYGVFVFTMYVAFLAYVTWFSVRSFRAAAPSARFLLPFVCAFVLSGFANSSYVLQPTNWLFLGTILMMVGRATREMNQLRANRREAEEAARVDSDPSDRADA